MNEQKPCIKTIIVYDEDEERSVKSERPIELVKYAQWINDKIATIPTEYRSNAIVDVDASVYYECGYLRYKISYTRPMTVEEIEAEDQEKQARTKAKRDQELRTLAELKAKYPDSQ